MRVAAGAIARKFLRERLQIVIHGYLAQMGPIVLQPVNPQAAYDNPFFCPGSRESRNSRISSGGCAKPAIPSVHA